MPLAPALASTTPLLGVAALQNDDASSSFVVAVTAAGGGVSIVDGRSQVSFHPFIFSILQSRGQKSVFRCL